jgi:hypothetical protein
MEGAENRATSFGFLDVRKEGNLWFKILTHFIKGKIALSPMETISFNPRQAGIPRKPCEIGSKEKG